MNELFASDDAARFGSILELLVDKLSPEDDAALWRTVITHILGDAAFLCQAGKHRHPISLEIGRCSHWLRPHHYRWPEDGSFAVPVGYGGSGFSLKGLPEFDWSLFWNWNFNTRSWQAIADTRPCRALHLRVTIPSRTARHKQAAVHTLWMPGSPVNRRSKRRQFYGFRKRGGQWLATAYRNCDRKKISDDYDCLADR